MTVSSIVDGSAENRTTEFDEIGAISDGDLDPDIKEELELMLATQNNPSDEAHTLLEIIGESLNSLFRVAILTRKTAPRDRFQHALRSSKSAFPPSFDIDHVRHKHPKLSKSPLSTRLGTAIAQRRQFIKYSREHAARLAAVEIEFGDADGPDAKAHHETATTARQSSKATTFVHQPALDVARQLDDSLELVEEQDNMSIMTASTSNDSFAVLRLPRLADISSGRGPFECPICFTLQSFQQERAWR